MHGTSMMLMYQRPEAVVPDLRVTGEIQHDGAANGRHDRREKDVGVQVDPVGPPFLVNERIRPLTAAMN